jgi:hypothetical protein
VGLKRGEKEAGFVRFEYTAESIPNTFGIRTAEKRCQ